MEAGIGANTIIAIISLVTSVTTAIFVTIQRCLPHAPKKCLSSCCKNGYVFDVEEA